VDFKIRDIDREKDNYIDKKVLVFNSYKTAKTYQRQEIAIPPELLKILNKWIKLNPTDYLLFDSNSKKLSNVKLTQRLNKIFGKKASVNQLRHSYLSDKYQDTIKLNNDMADDMAAMGSSRHQEKIYIKKD
jgi:integrase